MQQMIKKCHCAIENKNKYVHKGENKHNRTFCVVLFLYVFQLKVGEMHLLSYFRELVCHWLIYILFISESQDSLEQLMSNL